MSFFRGNPEQHAFRQHSADLIHAIDSPDHLAWQLFSDGLISSGVKSQVLVPMLSNVQKNGILLSTIEGKIKAEPSIFLRFVESLQGSDDSTLRLMGSKMKATYGTVLLYY